VGILSKKTDDNKNIIDIILESLNKNYDCKIHKLCASDFYVPQPGGYILYDTWPLMHMNPSFALYRFEESVGGNFNVIEDYTPLPQSAVEIDTDVLPETVPQNVIESLSSCASAVPLRCYGVDDNTGIPYLKTGSECEKMEISNKVFDIS
jgi:hypothetical protein